MNRLLYKTVRTAYRTIMPRGARNSLATALVLDRKDRAPEPITDFTARHVLVLAPHMDDETIGCGGAILLHRQAGAPVTVVYTTDGRQGNPKLKNSGLTEAQISAEEDRLVETRRQEAYDAARILDVTKVILLNGQDGGLTITDELVGRLKAIFEECRPDVVYVPSVLDLHNDHWMTCGILWKTLVAEELNRSDSCMIRGYEVWMPAFANRVADTSAVHETKMRALHCFTSQLEHVNYVRAIEGMNMYRSIHRFSGSGYAEAFHEMTASEFCEVYQKVNVRS